VAGAVRVAARRLDGRVGVTGRHEHRAGVQQHLPRPSRAVSDPACGAGAVAKPLAGLPHSALRPSSEGPQFLDEFQQRRGQGAQPDRDAEQAPRQLSRRPRRRRARPRTPATPRTAPRPCPAPAATAPEHRGPARRPPARGSWCRGLPVVDDGEPDGAGNGDECVRSGTVRRGGRLRSRFATIRVRPAGKAVERPAQATAWAKQGCWDGILPDCRLLVEWSAETEAPTDYRLSGLPAGTPIADLVRLAKVRWRIEHDDRRLKHGLGLDHFEGRSGPAGTTTSPSSRPPTCSSPDSAWLQKPLHRPHALPDPRRPPGHPEVLDRHLHHLPPTPSRQDRDTKTKTDPTESYQGTPVLN